MKPQYTPNFEQRRLIAEKGEIAFHDFVNQAIRSTHHVPVLKPKSKK